MKKIFTYIFLLFIYYSAQGQTLVLPNFSFENWTGSTPTNWADQNGGGSITQTTPGYVGSYAVKGTLVYTNPNTYTPTLVSQAGGFSVSQQYTYLRFYYKINLAAGGGGTDKMDIEVDMRDASNNSAGYAFVSTKTITANATNFTEKQVKIIYTGTPAKANITFTVLPTGTDPYAHVGTWFIIDSVSLSNVAVGVNEIEETNKLQIFPNPVHEKLNIKTEATQAMQISLSDAIGNIVLHRLSSEPVNGIIEDAINTESLSSGLYILMLTSDKKTILRRVMVN